MCLEGAAQPTSCNLQKIGAFVKRFGAKPYCVDPCDNLPSEYILQLQFRSAWTLVCMGDQKTSIDTMSSIATVLTTLGQV
jgi:hypothetical protein